MPSLFIERQASMMLWRVSLSAADNMSDSPSTFGAPNRWLASSAPSLGAADRLDKAAARRGKPK